jgi:hypothetical protein
MDVGAPDAHAALERRLCGLSRLVLSFFAGGECRTGTGAKTFDEVEAYDT